MKTIFAPLGLSAMMICGAQSETFSSSTNFIRTLSVGTNEAIFVTTLKYSGRQLVEQLSATVFRGGQTVVIPLLEWYQNWPENQRTKLLAGPMEIQFQQNNVIMEFQRFQTTNVFTTFFSNSNPAVISIPAGKTINLLPPTSFDAAAATPFASITLSNNVTELTDALRGYESFDGPLSIKILPSGNYGLSPTSLTNGWVTYYFTEEFASLPNLGATMVPAGNSILTIERSPNLTNWSAVFFKPVSSEQSGFFRFKFSK